MEYLRIYRKELMNLINETIVHETKNILIFHQNDGQLRMIEGMVMLADAIEKRLEPKKEEE